MSPYSRAHCTECPGQLRASSRALPRKKFPFGPGGKGSCGDITACAISKVYPFALHGRIIRYQTRRGYSFIIRSSISASVAATFSACPDEGRVAPSSRLRAERAFMSITKEPYRRTGEGRVG